MFYSKHAFEHVELPLRHFLSDRNLDSGEKLDISLNTLQSQNRLQHTVFYAPYPQTHQRSCEDPTDYLKYQDTQSVVPTYGLGCLTVVLWKS